MSQPKVDRQAKIIRDYRVMSLGEARGHGMLVDDKTLDQLVELGNAMANGVKTRVRHADASGDGFGRMLGKSRNFRRTPDGAIADLHLSDLAFKSPEGDLGTYVMDAAEKEPDTFGASPEAIHRKEPLPGSQPAMRLKELLAIAIVDDPATNVGFFSRLDSKDSDMSDATALEKQVADLKQERDTLAAELSTTKLSLTKLQADHKVATEGHAAALLSAKAEGVAAAVKAERERVADVIALCTKAQKVELSAKYIADGTPKAEVQDALFVVLCANNKPLGDDGNGNPEKGGANKNDPNAKYKAEYVALSAAYQAAGVSEEDYIKTRRVDDGLDQLIKLA